MEAESEIGCPVCCETDFCNNKCIPRYTNESVSHSYHFTPSSQHVSMASSIDVDMSSPSSAFVYSSSVLETTIQPTSSRHYQSTAFESTVYVESSRNSITSVSESTSISSSSAFTDLQSSQHGQFTASENGIIPSVYQTSTTTYPISSAAIFPTNTNIATSMIQSTDSANIVPTYSVDMTASSSATVDAATTTTQSSPSHGHSHTSHSTHGHSTHTTHSHGHGHTTPTQQPPGLPHPYITLDKGSYPANKGQQMKPCILII